MEKYKLVTINGIHTKIAKKTDVEGYTEGIMEIFFPDKPDTMSIKAQREWTKENNERMIAICDFLNKTYKK